MAIFYNSGEKRNVPSVYMRYSSRDESRRPIKSTSKQDSIEMLLADKNGTLLKSVDGKYIAVKQ